MLQRSRLRQLEVAAIPSAASKWPEDSFILLLECQERFSKVCREIDHLGDGELVVGLR